MKKHLIISIILISSFNCTAQEYSIGAETGLHYDFISVIYEHYKCGQAFTGWDMGSITFSYTTPNHLILKTGINYQNYLYNIGIRLDNFKVAAASETAFRSIYIPLRLGHEFKLTEKLYFNTYSGIDLILYFDQMHKIFNDTIGSIESIQRTLSVNTVNALKHGANLAMVTGIDFTLKTKYNVAYSLFCSYHAGLFDTWYAKGVFTQSNENVIYEPVFFSKGSHLNFGIGVSYIFKKE